MMAAVIAWSFGAVIAAAVVLALLERIRPCDRGQRFFRPGFWNDLVLYGGVQQYAVGVLVGHTVGLLDATTGLSRLELVTEWPALVQLACFTVAHDLGSYLLHRCQHGSRVLWRLHEAHHSVRDVDWLAGARSHGLEAAAYATLEFAPLVLLGATPEVIVMKGALTAAWAMFIHANVDVRLGPLRYIINGPAMHRWHHAVEIAPVRKNFAIKLALWDWVFGTAYDPHHAPKRARAYGLADVQYPEEFPSAYVAHHLYPFRRRRPAALSGETGGANAQLAPGGGG